MRQASDTPQLAGVRRFSAGSGSAHPHLAIVGALHGNEHCGLSACERIAEELARGTLRLRAGTLSLVHGNPAASAERRRHVTGGVDLNRLFDYRFVDELAESAWEPEHRRAAELRPLLDEVDAAVDLHSATAPTPAFAIASRVAASEPLAMALGLEYVTFGWDGPGLLGDHVLLGVLTRRDRPGVAVECGQHDDPRAAEIAYRCSLRALGYFGMIDPAEVPASAAIPRQLVVRAAVKRPSVSFRFERPLSGMQQLVPGDVIGHGDQVVMSVRSPCRVIMPNDRVAVGEDMLYLADERPSAAPDEPALTEAPERERPKA